MSGAAIELNAARRRLVVDSLGIWVIAIIVGVLWATGGGDDDKSSSDTTASTTATTTTDSASTLPPLEKTKCSDKAPEPPAAPKTYDKAPDDTLEAGKFYVATIET